MKNIKGFLETSFVDWPGRVCSVIFLAGCNFRCPFCHNHPLVLKPEKLVSISLEEVEHRLSRYKKWLGGVCITGGEPTLNPELPDALLRLKEAGWPIKLDTNGSRPEILAQLLAAGFIDMISMDVKAPLDEEQYSRCAGVAVDLAAIRSSISLIKQSGVAHEFRMTVLPLFHSAADIRRWRQDLAHGPISPLKLQNFNSRSTLDKSLEEAKPFDPDIFSKLQEHLLHQEENQAAASQLN
jgi:pyruvate formate lyase activating enzyme